MERFGYSINFDSNYLLLRIWNTNFCCRLPFWATCKSTNFRYYYSQCCFGLIIGISYNTAYERYWEGRRLWTSIGTAALNVVRQIWTSVAEIENEERVKKYSVIPLLIAFAVVTKLYLRAEPVNAELKELMPSSEYSQLKTASNPRLEIT